ncbi:MAG: YeeE/YedE thiosulfate transporter family protein [Deltaproteobacteria bacterium]
MGPLYKFGWFDFAYSLQMAGLIGFLFGFVLERAGFGNARKLTAIFYLRDFAVLKVMFTAIVVCMLGLFFFSVFGWIDLSKVYLLPTFIWPQIVGGFVLGMGFVVGGYCPTTSVVATVSGKLDALIFLVGMVLGSIVFAELFPVLKPFYVSGSMGAVRLSDVLKLNAGVVALLVSLMAVGAYWFVGSRRAKLWAASVLVALGLVLAIVNPDQIAAKRKASVVQKPPKTEAVQKTTPKKAEPASTGAVIIEDEGC